ncbi:SusD/RagB family nutrient-binding outer membrane lipoprotein [Flexithrix dorotheae]|uniref:SusD/RagB family nutrient-binding outer membrane lipoprotein n=1 Tax=Flexithrix dorotheae TaxID=70993 RepID=UPI0003A92E77|nr:SusD/RagB family nutrient-binding outer membrane lipoprotein [Flexithrix dorotheae]
MKKNIIYKFLVAIMLLFSLGACEDYLDINVDPDNPTTATPFQLLPAVQMNMAFTTQDALNRMTSTFVQRLNNFRFEFFALNGGDTNNDWNRMYRTLLNAEDIITIGTEQEQWHYVGVAKILKAYMYSVMVDLFNDVPYTEASLGATNFSAKFDDGAMVYDEAFALLDEGIADLQKESKAVLGATGDDLTYGGDLEKWEKMANTLKLKLLNQIRLADPQRATEGINALLANPDKLIGGNNENFSIPFFNSSAPLNWHPYYQTFHSSKGENDLCTFYDQLLTTNNDPRYPYLIYQQSGAFEGRDPADALTNRGNDDDTKSIFAIYINGGLYDDGGAKAVDATDGTGDAPARLVTYFMRKFIEAEAVLTLPGVSGDAKALLEEAIRASFSDVNVFSVSRGAPEISSEDIDTYVAARLDAYDNATTDAERLEVIMVDKYVALSGNGIESYNDYRRTGFPVLSTPIQPDGPWPLRLPYASDEIESNPNAPTQPLETEPVFWDMN